MPRPPRDAADERLAHRIVRVLSTASGAEAAIDAVVREVATTMGSPLGAVWLLDDDGLLRLRCDWAEDEEFDELRRVGRRLTFSPGVGLLGRVMETHELQWVEDVAEAGWFPRAEMTLAAGLRRVVAAPLLSPGGFFGVLELFGRDSGEPDLPELADLAMAGRQLAAYLERLQVEDRLRMSEEAGAAIVRAALDCIVTMDHEGRVLDFNPAAEATFGYERDDVVGRLLGELIIPPALREAHARALQRYVEAGQATILGRRLELEGMRADGSTLPVELTVTRLGTQEPPVFAGFIRDIGERRALEAEQARLLRAAEDARARLAFLARAGRQMAESMDWEATLANVVRAAVPVVAEWAMLTVVERGRLRVAAVAHADPAREAQARELAERYPPAAGDAAGPAEVVRTGRMELGTGEPALPARDERHRRLLAALGGGHTVTMPLRTPAGVLGALTLVKTAAGFGDDELELIGSFAARASLHIQNARLYTERSHIARTLQASLRPRALPPVPGAQIAARFLPAGEQNQVGGDFYDLYPAEEGVWAAVIGDVAGKGAEAAAVTALARHTLRTASMLHHDPADNLTLLNRALLAQGEHAFCTAVYGRLCPAEGGGIDIRFANGGHPDPLVLRRDGAIEAVRAIRGPLLGAVEDATYAESALRLEPGDLLVMYTDGVTEVRTSDMSLGERELRAVLAENAGASAETVAGAVERRAVELQQGEPRDDIAVLVVRAL